MARVKRIPTKDISPTQQKSANKKGDSKLHKPRASNTKSNDETSVDSPFGTNNTKAKRASLSSKRKSLLPHKRRTFTEEYKSLSKSITINKFGRPEKCYRKTYNELKFYLSTTFLLIPKLPFSRLVREIIGQRGNFRITSQSLEALQESAEIYLITLFQAANLAASHAKRKTLKTSDMTLVQFIRNLYN